MENNSDFIPTESTGQRFKGIDTKEANESLIIGISNYIIRKHLEGLFRPNPDDHTVCALDTGLLMGSVQNLGCSETY